MYPPRLQAIADLFAGLAEPARRELLIHYAAGAVRYAPQPGETFDINDVRHDAECTDKVGIHLRIEEGCHFRITLGPEVQTLTRALSAILCQGLDGLPPAEVATLPESIVDAVVGTELVRLRSRTVYYIVRRLKEAAGAVIAPASEG